MKVRIKFSKQGAMKFIGHLDIMRYFQKAIRRAEIPIVFTEGFSPHMVMSFASPLGVGLTSDAEYMDIEVRETISSKEAVKRLNDTMVEGMKILSYRMIPDVKASKAMSLVAAADYTVAFRDSYSPKMGWQEKIEDFISLPSITILKKTKKSEKEVDIKPFIFDMHLTGEGKVFLRLAAGSVNNLKPELVMDAFAAYLETELPPFVLLINRVELYAENMISLEDLGEEIE